MTETEREIIKAYEEPQRLKWISKSFNISKKEIKQILINNGCEIRSNSSLYKFNYNFFEEINNSKKAYWLGFLLADGYTNKLGLIGIEIHPKDLDVLVAFKRDIESTHPIKIYNKKSTFGDQQLARIILKNKKTYTDLQNLGFTTAKTTQGIFPPIDPLFERDLIRGYLDGNGSITKSQSNSGSKFSVNFCGTKEILQKIEYISGEDWCWYQRFPERETNNYQIALAQRIKVKKFLDFIFYEGVEINMERKHKRYLEFSNLYF